MSHSRKILAQAGVSLADIYDIEGSVVGVETLDADEVKAVHEMGQTLFSERFSTQIFSVDTGPLLQNATISVGLEDLPSVPARILGLVVMVDTTARVLRVAVNASKPAPGPVEELPIWTWESGGGETTARFTIAGVTGDQILLDSNLQFDRVPMLRAGADQPESLGNISLRGVTSGFGAGDVTVTLRALLGFPEMAGVSSFGLPIPSW